LFLAWFERRMPRDFPKKMPGNPFERVSTGFED
jgi:hypothetical protein